MYNPSWNNKSPMPRTVTPNGAALQRLARPSHNPRVLGGINCKVAIRTRLHIAYAMQIAQAGVLPTRAVAKASKPYAMHFYSIAEAVHWSMKITMGSRLNIKLAVSTLPNTKNKALFAMEGTSRPEVIPLLPPRHLGLNHGGVGYWLNMNACF